MTPVSVQGIGAVTGYGAGVAALAAGLRSGRTAIRPLADGEWPALGPLRQAALPPGLGDGDLLAGLPEACRRSLRGARRSLLLAAAAAAEAMPEPPADGDIGLVIGGSNLFAAAIAEAEARRAAGRRPTARHGVEMFDSHAVGVLSEALGIRGPGITVGAASASGVAAVVAAVDMLRAGRVAHCLVVAGSAELAAADWSGLDLIGALADGRRAAGGALCRPFDAAATGFVPGEIAAAMLLAATPSGIRLTGTALRLDGTAQPSPSRDGEVRVIREALAEAGVAGSALDLVSAHATSTPLGDRIEAEALAEACGAAVAVNAPKGLIGHGLNAAGLVETVVAVIQLRDGFVHPNAALAEPVVPLRYAGSQAENRMIRRVLKTSFGFGGFNAALVLEASA